MLMFKYVISGFYNYLIILALFAIIEILIYRYYSRQNIKMGIGFITGWLLLSAIMVIIFSITGVAGINDIGHYGKELIRLDEINIIPFRWATPFGLIMNAVLFVPFGMIVPMLFEKGVKLWDTVYYGFILSLLIEISQLFNHRASDIDDLLMNTLGTLVGYGIYYLALRGFTFMRLKNKGNLLAVRKAPILNILLIFSVYFFIGTYCISLFWNMIYR